MTNAENTVHDPDNGAEARALNPDEVKGEAHFGHGHDRSWALGLTLSVEAGLGLVGVGLGWLFGVWPLHTLAWNLDAFATGILATIPMLIVFLAGYHSRWKPLVEIHRRVDEILVPLLRPCSLVDLAIISLAAGIGEEVLFRGFLQAIGSDYLGPAAGLTLASAGFGLAHAVTPTYALLAGLIGMYLGAIWLFTGNLWAPIITHALYDFVALFYYLRRPPK